MSTLAKSTVDSPNTFSAGNYFFNVGELDSSQIQTSNVNLMFVDSAVQNIDSLIKTLTDNTIAIALDRDEDGIEQITQALGYFDSIPSLHLVSHGHDGEFQLGSTTLNSSNIAYYKDKLELWRSSFTEDADTLVYGCNVAGDYIGDGIYSGDPLLGQLSHYTGTDVAASTDFTGSREQGGDWVLERVIGDIESGIGFKETIRESYSAVLPKNESNSNLRIEAENLQRPEAFRIESNKLFSGDKAISLRGGKWNEQGRAVYVHKGDGGIYDLKLNYFDENAGPGNIKVLVNNTLVDQWSLNRNSGSSDISANNRQVRTIKGLELEAGDRISFVGKEHRKEFLRIDYFDLTKTNPLPNPLPPPATNSNLRIEAENLQRPEAFRIESNKLFSGGKAISLRGGKWNEQGRAVYVHKGARGIYDLKLNYFDENDGTGNIKVLVNNILVDQWSLNRNSGSSDISANNRQVRTIKGLELEAGDRITFVGKEHRKESLRIDYFDLKKTNRLPGPNPEPAKNPPGNDNPPGTIRIGAVQVKLNDLGPTLTDTIREYDKLVKNAASKGVDILLFPEGISRIKTNNGKNLSFEKAAEDPKKGTLSLQYKEWASEHGMYILGHIYEQNKGDSDIYNSQIIFNDNGKYIGTHRKILLPSGGELKNLTPGNEIRVFDIENIKVGVAICYDVFGNKDENEPLGTMVNDLGAELIFYPNWSTEYDFAYPNLAELNVPFVVGTAMNNDLGGRQNNVLKTGVYDREGDLISSEVLETSSGIAYADYDISDFE
ncbi:MAG: DUF4347 domain-containing protein [Synechococcus sp.]